MLFRSDEHADEDRQQRELVDARNKGDSMCWQIEKMMKEQGDKLKDADRQPMDAAIEKVREASKGDDVAAINSSIEELEQASHAFSKTLYEGAAAAAGADGAAEPEVEQPAGATAGDDDVVDAEFEVKDA